MGVNIVLVVTSVVFAILVVLASIYFLVYFQHPDDKWVAWFPKIVVVTGLSLAAFNLFLLPLDVANQRSNGNVPMDTLTLAFYIATVLIVIVAVPFTVFFYEGTDDSDEKDNKKSGGGQLVYAIKWLIPTVLFAGAIIGLMYWQLGYADIPTSFVTGTLVNNFDFNADYCAPIAGVATCTFQTGYNYPWVSWLVYTVAIVSFVGWIIFTVFGGVGLVALPYDLILEFQHRPKPITAAEYAERKVAIGQQAGLLLEVGRQLTEDLKGFARQAASTRFNRRWRNLRQKETEFRKDTLILEFHFRRLEDAFKRQGGDILFQFVKLAGGCVGAVLSLLWVVHIIVYLIPLTLKQTPYSSFLNDFFDVITGVPFIGTAFYALFTFYLLFCVIKGNAKLGMRLVFITIHPLRIGETMMNSLVFNTGIILLSSLSVAQFCTLAFAKYARYTASNSLFGVQMQNLHGIQYGYDAFIFLILGFAGLTAGYSIYKPYNKQREHRMNFKW
ncbi:hypothetical protein HK101_009569 [Irineochytrium annulatum]|nr:hypothetical protein HK101_009569 [Irineochytrium annulatum]